MPEQTKFFQLDITRTEHGAALEQDGSRIDLGFDQLEAVGQSIIRIAKVHRAECGRKMLDELSRDLKAEKPRPVSPINPGSNGKGPKGAA